MKNSEPKRKIKKSLSEWYLRILHSKWVFTKESLLLVTGHHQKDQVAKMETLPNPYAISEYIGTVVDHACTFLIETGASKNV